MFIQCKQLILWRKNQLQKKKTFLVKLSLGCINHLQRLAVSFSVNGDSNPKRWGVGLVLGLGLTNPIPNPHRFGSEPPYRIGVQDKSHRLGSESPFTDKKTAAPPRLIFAIEIKEAPAPTFIQDYRVEL